MEQYKKTADRESVVFALLHVATYLPATWLLTNHVVAGPAAVAIAIVPVITFAIFILKLIRAFAVMDEVKQRVQLEAVVIGFSLTVMLMMLLFLLGLCGISSSEWFGYGYIIAYCWAFYFIGWFVSGKKYGI